MKPNWKEIKIEIDALPTTEKTIVLKKKAEGFEKELREHPEHNHACRLCHQDTSACKLIKEILGESP
jgi:hypothetical protein